MSYKEVAFASISGTNGNLTNHHLPKWQTKSMKQVSANNELYHIGEQVKHILELSNLYQREESSNQYKRYADEIRQIAKNWQN